MRSDENLSRRTLRFSPGWRKNALTGESDPGIDRRLAGGRMEGEVFKVHSLSGSERNQFYYNRAGKAFENLSALSGLDNVSDGRGFVLLDYDRDGWQDIALVNANDPLVNLYRNRIGELSPGRRVIAVQFVGGNRSAVASSDFACRDGYGALVTATVGETHLKLKREHRCGEGYATQNSATMILGIGDHAEVADLSVRWPSGRSATTKMVPAGTLLTVYENPADTPDGNPFVRSRYLVPARPSANQTTSVPRQIKFPVADLAEAGSKLMVFTTMATWCPACIDHVPEMTLMTETLEPEGVRFYGVPIEVKDSPEKLRAFKEKWKTPYHLFADLPNEQRETVTQFLQKMTGSESPGVPSTIVTDAEGHVLLVGSGVPSISVLRKVLAKNL